MCTLADLGLCTGFPAAGLWVEGTEVTTDREEEAEECADPGLMERALVAAVLLTLRPLVHVLRVSVLLNQLGGGAHQLGASIRICSLKLCTGLLYW